MTTPRPHLVRDRVPTLHPDSEYRRATNDEMGPLLRATLTHAAGQVTTATSRPALLQGLGDLWEAMTALAHREGYTPEHIHRAATTLREDLGGYERQYMQDGRPTPHRPIPAQPSTTCPQHPNAPRIGGQCGACTRYPTSTPPPPRRFHLVRDIDVNGTSGTGTVAEGAQFDDGVVALRWLTPISSTAIYTSIDDLTAIHGHGGATRLEWVDPPRPTRTRTKEDA